MAKARDIFSKQARITPSQLRPPYVEQLSAALQKALPGAEVDIEHVRTDRYRFVVVWPGFDGMGHPERQELVWDLTEKTLARSELRKVTMILTVGHDDLPKE
ncbi:MAG TPA: hypothetical protein VFE47_21315 [Tepidisphaeraceae bacterium]|nr:hypothetical protein [Tepidisphaeraceae bacterium]